MTGLWKQLEKAGQTVSFEKLALEVFDEAHRELADGKSLETDGLLGLRVGRAVTAFWRGKSLIERLMLCCYDRSE